MSEMEESFDDLDDVPDFMKDLARMDDISGIKLTDDPQVKEVDLGCENSEVAGNEI